MIADLDFDVVAHLGYVRNIDLLQKGLYIIQVTLHYGKEGTRIAPVGLFSAPSTLQSYVKDRPLPPARLCNVCEVDDAERQFRSRSFVIRYKDEKHELNDGVHWRFTLPKVDLSGYEFTDDFEASPICTELLHMRFELLFSPLIEESAGDLFSDIDSFIPDNPSYETVATQNIIIQKAGSGIHEYYPIRFKRSYYIDLDCMIHCSVSAIRYHTISPAVIPSLRRVHKEKENLIENFYSNHDDKVSTEPIIDINIDNSGIVREPIIPDNNFTPKQLVSPSTIDVRVWVDDGSPMNQSKYTDQTDISFNEFASNASSTPLSKSLLHSSHNNSNNIYNTNSNNNQIIGDTTPIKQTNSTPYHTKEQPITTPITPASARKVNNFSSPTPYTTIINAMPQNSSNKPKRSINQLFQQMSSPDLSLASIENAMNNVLKINLSSQKNESNSSSLFTNNSNNNNSNNNIKENKNDDRKSPNPIPSARPGMKPYLANSTTDNNNNLNSSSMSDNNKPTKLVAKALFTEGAFPSQIITPNNDNEDNQENDSNQATIVENDEDYSNYILQQSDLIYLLNIYSKPIVANNTLLVHSTTQMIDNYLEWKKNNEQNFPKLFSTNDSDENNNNNNNNNNNSVVVSPLKNPHELCVLASKRQSILEELVSHSNNIYDVIAIIREKIDECNLQQSMRWSTMMSAFKNIMPSLCSRMRIEYLPKIQLFWRMQMLIQTKSIYETNKYPLAEEQALITIMQNRLKAEESMNSYALSFDENDVENRVEFSDSTDLEAVSVKLLSRGMRVFDMDVNQITTRLPFLILQQYVDNVRPRNKKLLENITTNVDFSSVYDQTLKPGTVHLSRGGRIISSKLLLDTTSIEDMSYDVLDIGQYKSIQPIVGRTFHFDMNEAKIIFHQNNDLLDNKQQNDLKNNDDIILKNDLENKLLTTIFDNDNNEHFDNNSNNNDYNNSNNDNNNNIVTNPLNNKSSSLSRPPLISNRFDKLIHSPLKTPLTHQKHLKHHRGDVIVNDKNNNNKNDDNNDENDDEPPIHLIVLQHGFLGNSYDMRLIQNIITAELPSYTQVFCPRSNEEQAHSQDSIVQMAKRLAFELLKYCEEKAPSLLFKYSKSRISFICHSMGGLMVRKALEESTLGPLLSKLHTYVSLASPHVGTLFADSQIVST
eukprot:gene10970-14734_t